MTTADTSPLSPRQRSIFQQLLNDFLSDGFRDFTIDHAASKYQCSKSTIYGLGGTKNEIIYRVLVSFFKELTRRTSLTIKGNKPAPAKLQDYFTAITTALEPASPAFMQDLITSEVGKKVYDRNTKAAIETVHNLLEEGVSRGEFRAIDTRLIAAFIGHTLEHIQQGDYQDLASIPEAYSALSTLIRNGLYTPPNTKACQPRSQLQNRHTATSK